MNGRYGEADLRNSRERGMGQMQGHLRTVFLVHSDACNLNCRYCFNPRSSKALLSFDDICRFLDCKIARFGEEGSIVHFGGEPLLNREVIIRTVQRYPSLQHQIVTNGTLLDEPFIAIMGDYGVEFEISLDGDYEITAQNKSLSPESFEKIRNSIRLIQARGGQDMVSSSTVADFETCGRLFESYRYLVENMGLKRIGWNLARVRGMHYDLKTLSEQLHRIYSHAFENQIFFACVIPLCDPVYCSHRSSICALTPWGDILSEQNAYALRDWRRDLYEKFLLGTMESLEALKMPPPLSSRDCTDPNRDTCKGRYCTFLMAEDLLEPSLGGKACRVISQALQDNAALVESYYAHLPHK